jgi:hypothetical protein
MAGLKFQVSRFKFVDAMVKGKKRYSEKETPGRKYAAAVESCKFNV